MAVGTPDDALLMALDGGVSARSKAGVSKDAASATLSARRRFNLSRFGSGLFGLVNGLLRFDRLKT
jgi:hypothetical protein